MALKQRLVKRGNSKALVIPKAIIELLGWNTSVDVRLSLAANDRGFPCLIIEQPDTEPKGE